MHWHTPPLPELPPVPVGGPPTGGPSSGDAPPAPTGGPPPGDAPPTPTGSSAARRCPACSAGVTARRQLARLTGVATRRRVARIGGDVARRRIAKASGVTARLCAARAGGVAVRRRGARAAGDPRSGRAAARGRVARVGSGAARGHTARDGGVAARRHGACGRRRSVGGRGYAVHAGRSTALAGGGAPTRRRAIVCGARRGHRPVVPAPLARLHQAPRGCERAEAPEEADRCSTLEKAHVTFSRVQENHQDARDALGAGSGGHPTSRRGQPAERYDARDAMLDFLRSPPGRTPIARERRQGARSRGLAPSAQAVPHVFIPAAGWALWGRVRARCG